ncbi:MAG: hypothetical protein II295_10485 [Akkermansia sp.]|nr:hypothetical protein [Akkermansia sp.]
MAIRMKEWGMLSAPGAGVHIPVQGVMGWDSAARSLGSGIASFIEGSTAWAQEKEQVTATGDLADFSRRLQHIGEEIRSELSERDIEDWDYSWQQASAPRLAEAVAELPPAAREAGRELAAAYSRRASVQALRDREVARLGQARTRWQQRVDAAVQAGDADGAEAWLQSGAGVFVPEQEVESTRQQVRSRASVARWRSALAQQPLQALADYDAAAEQSLPAVEDDARTLRNEVERCRSIARSTLAGELMSAVKADTSYEAATLQQAQQAGLLTAEQVASATAEPRRLQPHARCTWMQRVDECPADSSARTNLVLDIATAALPMEERRQLLERLEMAATVAPSDRLALSRCLRQLYDSGALGCPGDAVALQRLADLQLAGLPILAREGSEAAARWAEQQRSNAGQWVCFENTEK